MVSAKIIRFAIQLFLALLTMPLAADNGWLHSIQRTDEKTRIEFSEELAVEKLVVPCNSEKIWGPGKRCLAATVIFGKKQFISSAVSGEKGIVFFLDHLIGEGFEIKPVFTEPNIDENEGILEIVATRAQTRRIELKIAELSQRVLSFQQQNQCFSCHTLFPLALTINEADKNGFRISSEQVKKLGESLGSMQSVNGSYFFARQPDYGTISTSLCAGSIFAMLARFDRRMLVNLEKIYSSFHAWLDEENDLKSDFFFRPLFIGKTASALFEALIVAALYYQNPTVTGIARNENLRQRLMHLNKRFKVEAEAPVLQNLLLLTGLPYIGQFGNEQIDDLTTTLNTFQQQSPQASRADIAALTALFFSRMNNKNGLQQLKLPQTIKRTLSEEIWLCLIKVLQNQAR